MKSNRVLIPLLTFIVAMQVSLVLADAPASPNSTQSDTLASDPSESFLGNPQTSQPTPAATPPALVMTAQPVARPNIPPAPPVAYTPPPPPPQQAYNPSPSRKQKRGPFQHVTNFFKSLAGVD